MALVDLIKGMDYGAGVDLGGQLFGDAVLRSPPVEIPDTGGKTEDIFLTLVESQEEQDSAIQLSTSVSASYGLFGGSGKFDLSQEMHVHDFAISLIIRSTVLTSFSQMRDVKLGPEAMRLLSDGQEPRFREQFGDMFVRGIQSGGELVAILQIEGHDADDQSSVRADLEASGILGAVAASTSDSFASHVSKATSGRKVKLRHFQIGGNLVASIKPEEMVQHALNLGNEVRAGQKEAFQALLVSYKTLDIPKPPNFIDLENARETIDTLMGMRRSALTRLAAFNFVVANPQQFDIPPDMKISAIVSDFETAIAKLGAAASRCVNSPAEAPAALLSVAGLNIPTNDLPERRRSAGDEQEFAGRGQLAITGDALLTAMRLLEPEGPGRLGFEVGVGIAGSDTLWGPGKQLDIAPLPAGEQQAAEASARFVVARNAHAEFATRGAAIAAAEKRPNAVAARAAEVPGYYTLGFDLAAGIFGSAKIGGTGDTAQGSGSDKIRDGLPPAGVRGFQNAVKLYMGQ